MVEFATASTVRLACFVGALLLLSFAELIAPRRRHTIADQRVRWFSNLGLATINILAMRLLVPLGVTGVAIAVAQRGWGILNVLPVPTWIEFVVAVLVLDCVVFLQHVLFHRVPALWRLHMVHHADLELDVTTGVRFHTLEVFISLVIKSAAVAALGASPLAVLIFEILLNVVSMFNHGNLRLPLWLDSTLRWILVTPDMHRIHHSTLPQESSRNFGFNLPIWDRLFGTYQAQPARGHEEMAVGLSDLRHPRVSRLHWMLALPFVPKCFQYLETSAAQQNVTADGPQLEPQKPRELVGR